MKLTNRFIIACLFSLLVAAVFTHGQSTTMSIQVAPGSTSVNCVAIAAETVYCFTGGGNVYVSVNGAAFSPLVPASVTGLTGVSVCNVAGTSCAPAVVTSGVAQVNVPKSALSSATVGAPLVTSSGSTATIGAPSVTVSTTLQ